MYDMFWSNIFIKMMAIISCDPHINIKKIPGSVITVKGPEKNCQRLTVLCLPFLLIFGTELTEHPGVFRAGDCGFSHHVARTYLRPSKIEKSYE